MPKPRKAGGRRCLRGTGRARRGSGVWCGTRRRSPPPRRPNSPDPPPPARGADEIAGDDRLGQAEELGRVELFEDRQLVQQLEDEGRIALLRPADRQDRHTATGAAMWGWTS